ncbi:MAG: LptF/LptG family permease [Fibrobacter sp.]|nr:LptF/LptG family permease [Fibrobacter sp.]
MKFSAYLLRNFLKMFFLFLLGAVFIFIVIDFVGNIRVWLTRETKEAIDYYLCYLPYILYLVSPVALFIAVVASVGNMSRHLEISAMQSAGRNPLRILLPVFLVGFVCTGLSWVLSEKILPDANFKRFEIMETSAQQKKNRRVKDRSHFAYIGHDKTSWFFRHYSGTLKLGRDVSLLIGKEGNLQERYDARRMRWVLNEDSVTGRWRMENGYYRVFQNNGDIQVEPFHDKFLPETIRVYPEDFINERQTGDEMDSKMIKERIEGLRRSGEDTKALETAYYFKFSGPVMNFFVLLIGAALSHRFSRSGGLSQKFGIGIFFVFSYYIAIRIGLKMGENGALSPILSAWVAHFIFALISVVMLYRSFRL